MMKQFARPFSCSPLRDRIRARPLAHEGHEHKVMGTVTMAAADHVMLKDRTEKR